VRGHVAKKGKRYYPVVDVGRDPETGKRRQKWHPGHRTKKAAETALTDILGRLGRGEYVEPSRETVAAFLEEWLAALPRSRRPGTVALYETLARAYVLRYIGDVRLQSLTPARLNELYTTLLASGAHQGRPLSSKSVLNVHTTLHRALEDATRWGRLARNPATLADPPQGTSRAMRIWTAEELAAFLRHIREDRLYPAWLTLATTGLRRGELLGLQWPDIGQERLSISRTWILVGGQPTLSNPKTDAGKRTVPIPPETVSALKAWRARQAEERLAYGPAWDSRGFVFTREDGVPLHPDWFSRTFERYARGAGLPRIRVHDLRHTWASLALEAGVPAKVVQEILGHASVSITLDTYSHVLPAMREEAATTVAALIFPSAH
jgi:integrase